MPHVVDREEIGATTQMEPEQMRELIAQARPPIVRPVKPPSMHLRVVEGLLVFALALGAFALISYLSHHA